jgi:hypothetical protein
MNLTESHMRAALTRLNQLLDRPVTLIMGGGGAMILAHRFHIGTTDIDAIAKGIQNSELDPLVKQIAAEQGIPKDWLNPYFSTFSFSLPSDYGNRLIEVFSESQLKVLALGRDEMLIMKCFAHRQKDVPHAKSLIQAGANLDFVGDHIELLKKKGIPGSQEALDFLDDILDQI